jgi:nucleoside-diphosphate-sugar epimerase
MTAGEQIRDFTPVEQVASELLAAAMDADVPPGCAKIENIGSGQPQTIRAFAEHWWRRWGAQGRLVFGALPYREGEIMRYAPIVNLKAGVRDS